MTLFSCIVGTTTTISIIPGLLESPEVGDSFEMRCVTRGRNPTPYPNWWNLEGGVIRSSDNCKCFFFNFIFFSDVSQLIFILFICFILCFKFQTKLMGDISIYSLFLYIFFLNILASSAEALWQ